MSKETAPDPIQPGFTPQYLIARIEALNGQKAALLQKAQSIISSAQRAETELVAQANAVHGAIQQCEEFLGMLAEGAAMKELSNGSPEVAAPKAGKVTAKEVQRARAERQRRAAATFSDKAPAHPPGEAEKAA